MEEQKAERDVRLNIRLTPGQHAQLLDEASAQGRTIAEVVRRALGFKKPEGNRVPRSK